MLIGGGGLLWYGIAQRRGVRETGRLIAELDWESIFFLSGIFIVVGAVAETGLLEDFSAFLSHVTGGNIFVSFLLIIAVSIFISGFVDNVPYIIIMLPVASQLAASLGVPRELLMFALLIGSCLGGNLTPFGASANIVAMGILKKEGTPMTFKDWIKIGTPFTAITTAAGALSLWFAWR